MTDSNATERIKEMLAERDVEYHEYHSQIKGSMGPTTRFHLHDSEHKPYATIETGTSTCLLTWRCTPEQAIAATLGSGTCEWILEHSGTLFDKWRCSKCGYLFVEPRTVQGYTDLEPNFCPECGKAVKR